jgi:DNA invertase Pin-like site-specific DNA recombinase
LFNLSLSYLGSRSTKWCVIHPGSTFKRHQLEILLSEVQDGDTIIVTRVDRLGRNTKQLLQLVEDLQQRGFSLYIIELGLEAIHRNGKLSSPFYQLLLKMRESYRQRKELALRMRKEKG